MLNNGFSDNNANIDNVLDTLVDVQKKNNITPTLKEALFDPETKERINVFRRKKLEAQGVDMSKYDETVECSKKCPGCKKDKPDDEHKSNIERGIFVYNEDDLIDEEEGEYVCEHCIKIGYDGGYKPDICDTCDDCEGCTEYLSGDCDGCQYSTLYNGGLSYSQSTGQESTIDESDRELYDEIDDDFDDEVKIPTGGFTILDF